MPPRVGYRAGKARGGRDGGGPSTPQAHDLSLQARVVIVLLEKFRRSKTQGTRGRLIPAADVRVSIHENGLVLLHIPSGRIFQSNHAGAKIWRALADGLDLDAISERISREYDVPNGRARRDADCFVTQLEKQGFVSRIGA